MGSKNDNVPRYLPDNTTVALPNNGVIPGFSIALQNMVIGDKWEVWIPWSLGYGSAGYSSIPGFSTLVFQIELVDFIQYPGEKN
jgi:FKBP-type peptidyl-prolyl cis-trans isomerase